MPNFLLWRQKHLKHIKTKSRFAHVEKFSLKHLFYDNCRNSRTFIGLFLLSISAWTHEFIINAMRQ